MATYEVDLREIWVQTYQVEADSAEDAMQRVLDGNGIPLDDRLEYSDTPEDQNDVEFAVSLVDD